MRTATPKTFRPLLLTAALLGVLAAPAAYATAAHAPAATGGLASTATGDGDDIRCVQPLAVACRVICRVDPDICAVETTPGSADEASDEGDAPPPCPPDVRRVCIMVCRHMPLPLCRIFVA